MSRGWIPEGCQTLSSLVREYGADETREELASSRWRAYRYNGATGEMTPIPASEWLREISHEWLQSGRVVRWRWEWRGKIDDQFLPRPLFGAASPGPDEWRTIVVQLGDAVHRTGEPGRPPLARELYLPEFERRAQSHTAEATPAAEAQYLVQWLKTNHPRVALPTPKTIANNLRSKHRAYFQPFNRPKL